MQPYSIPCCTLSSLKGCCDTHGPSGTLAGTGSRVLARDIALGRKESVLNRDRELCFMFSDDQVRLPPSFACARLPASDAHRISHEGSYVYAIAYLSQVAPSFKICIARICFFFVSKIRTKKRSMAQCALCTNMQKCANRRLRDPHQSSLCANLCKYVRICVQI